jgi:hypothetical protein
MDDREKRILRLIAGWGRLYLGSDNEPDKERIGLGILAMIEDFEQDGEIKGEGYYTLNFARQF